MPPKTPSPPRRGRPRSVDAESAILSAAFRLLQKKPRGEVTAEAIAARAGVSKATIYKWWPNKALVALDAFISRIQTEVPLRDTGSARQDFTEQLKATIRFYQSPAGKMFRQFIAEGQSDSHFLRLFRERFLKPRRDALRVMWQRGVARGELREEVDPEVFLDLIFSPMIYRLLAGHAPLDDVQAEALVATAFGGLQKRGFPR